VDKYDHIARAHAASRLGVEPQLEIIRGNIGPVLFRITEKGQVTEYRLTASELLELNERHPEVPLP
jgi:hypothetical protein